VNIEYYLSRNIKYVSARFECECKLKYEFSPSLTNEYAPRQKKIIISFYSTQRKRKIILSSSSARKCKYVMHDGQQFFHGQNRVQMQQYCYVYLHLYTIRYFIIFSLSRFNGVCVCVLARPC